MSELFPRADEPRRVLLVQPYLPDHPLIADDPPEFSQPMGLCYLAAAAREAGHQVSLADLYLRQEHAPDALMLWLEEQRPQVVGISAPFTLLAPVVEDLARAVKAWEPACAVVAGGAHASSMPQEVLAGGAVDGVFLGEAEESFCAYLAGAAREDLDGAAWRDGGDMRLSPKQRWIKDLSQVPHPARDLLDLASYWQRSGRAGLGSWTSLITSRGCPFHCVFCSTHTVWGRRWRARSPEDVLAELSELAAMGIDTISLEDDNFTLDQERAAAILEGVLERGLKFSWATPNGLRADRLDRRLLELMQAAGFSQVKVAVESGHPRVNREVVKKKLDLAKTKDILREAHELGLPTAAFFVLGFPDETPEEMLFTLEFALERQAEGLSGADFFMATPYPGTELLAQARDMDRLLLSEAELPFANAFCPSLDSPRWDADLLWFMTRLGRGAFDGRPGLAELVGRCRAEGIGSVLAQGRGRTVFEVGSPEDIFILGAGWHHPEHWDRPVRWSKSRAALALWPSGQESLGLTLCTHKPGVEAEPLRGSVLAQGRELGSFALTDHYWHTLNLALPPELRQGRLGVEIVVERGWSPPGGDPRVLGVALSRVELGASSPKAGLKRGIKRLLGR
ncbi:MAG: B12-binding domain-containing radical SAM protein [Desulfarculaceae bacterium]|nr:B12-binding domain-containing radical SAM protein [Desulfarculaceae bacterium]MCF8072777.1 B12-binding domain-containing radical SAM protein [Desulfarculaceae bacterium]MCF8100945.1 B12-binding domain-containing radical SAM protein [Desulfarculaceae bacterium]MCF8117571.1 B12-binding domain-containing radical SAM protein [Desulfarculaceae bacterium]